MKQLLTALIFILFIGVNFAQDSSYQTRDDLNVFNLTTGTYWSDSLYNALYVTTDTTASDIDTLWEKTSSEFFTNLLYDWMNITIQDTGATYDDTLVVQYGIPRVKNNVVIDTIWQPVQFMRDSSWTNINGGRFLVDDASVHSYNVWIGNYSLIRILMTNVEVRNNRVARFWAILSKKNTRF